MATYAAYRHIELDNVGYGKKRVLKPPGGGSSDIFGAGNDATPRAKVKSNANQSQLSQGFFAGTEDAVDNHHQQPPSPSSASTASSTGSSAPETPRSKQSTGNDSHNRLFGPPSIRPPSTPNSKTYRSSISLSSASDKSSVDSLNGFHNQQQQQQQHNDVVAFRRIKRFRGSSGMARNPVTGDGVDMKPPSTRRYLRKTKEGNPVTGTGYEQHNGGGGSTGSSIAGSDKSSTDSSPSVAPVPRMKNRVPPGGFSSGLW